MRVTGARLEPFCLPLRAPVAGGREVREGVILRLVDEDGRVGLGEASPAPWVGGETLAAVRAALERVVDALRGGAGHETLEVLAAGLPPAAASALETARLDLAARRDGEALAVRLGGAVASVPVSALVSGETSAALAREGRERAAAGFRCLKLKVGGRPPGADVERLAALREGAGAAVTIRLDANRAWRWAEAREALGGAAALGVDLVEEPLREAEAGALERLRGETGIAVALDESIRDAGDLRRAVSARALDALVLKAARTGGPLRALALARRAADAGLRVIVTDSLETSVGGRLAVHLAAALPEPRAAVGLGGAVLLARDPGAPAGWGAAPWIVAAGPGLEATVSAREEGCLA